MYMKTLKEYIKEAEAKEVAIGHFNVSNLETLHGVYNAAQKISEKAGFKIPVIVGVSEGEGDFMGKAEISVLVKEIRDKDNYPIFLNADHHYSFESVKSVIDLGFDSAIIDASKFSIEENITLTKKCVDYARDLGEREERSVLIESEMGFIGQSSKVLDKIPEGVSKETMTDPEDAKFFVEQTKIDLLAPSVGNIHGMIKGGNPKLDTERIKEIKKACGVPLVLHGGSGISDEDFSLAIKAGISIIHISTEIRLAYKNALEKYLEEHPEEIAPYKFLAPTVEAVEKVVYNRLKLFNNL